MTMSKRPAAAPVDTPAVTVLSALRWVAVILAYGRRERARRFLELVLPRERHLEEGNTRP
jgi:hypothetical protein